MFLTLRCDHSLQNGGGVLKCSSVGFKYLKITVIIVWPLCWGCRYEPTITKYFSKWANCSKGAFYGTVCFLLRDIFGNNTFVDIETIY